VGDRGDVSLGDVFRMDGGDRPAGIKDFICRDPDILSFGGDEK